MSVGETLYKILIRAYPERFRAHHEEDLLQWFRQHRAAVRRQGGLLAGLRFWTLILRDLLASVPTQHVYAAGQGRKRRRRRNDQQQSDPIEIRHSDGALHSGRTRRSNRRHTSRHGSEIMDTLHQDTRLALRSFRRAPAFFVLAVTTLAVGVGFATTLFSVVQGVLLAPLPYAESERLVRVGAGLDRTSGKIYALSAPEAFDLQARNRSFEALAISRSLRVTVRGDGAPELFSGAMISAQFFDVFRVQPAHGRAFTPAEDEPGAPRVAVLGHDLWQRRWGGDSGILGQTVTLGRTAFEVVGIMPEDFRPPEALGQRNAEVWIPLALLDEATRNDRINHFLYGVGRLRPGVSLATAQADLTALSARAAEEYPELDEPGFGLVSLHRETVGRIDQTLLPLFGAVGLLLLIACTNVANLLLIRASARGREMALRTAIGASRNRIVRQLLTESLVLGLLGGGFGVAIALAGVRSFVALSPSNIPRLTEVGVDANVLAFAVLVSVLTSLLFGWIPALRSSRP
ncbi:MAG: ABC transporter permease, partial [Acidobacteriota bacterium]